MFVFTLGPPTSAPRRRWGLGPPALNVSQVQAVGGEGQADAWNIRYSITHKEYNFKGTRQVRRQSKIINFFS